LEKTVCLTRVSGGGSRLPSFHRLTAFAKLLLAKSHIRLVLSLSIVMSTDFVVVQKNWDSVTYCSDSCRKHKIKPNSLDMAFQSKILELLSQRRVAQGAEAVMTCEEAEEETSKKHDPLDVTPYR
jgi:hypothetical protein